MLGLGTKTNPFLVSTELDLDSIRNNPDAHYKLTNDIHLTLYQTGEGWLPIANFYGNLEGANYTIHDLYINRPDKSVGFFANLEDNMETGQDVGVYNLHFDGVNIVGGANTGAIAGTVKGFSDVYIDTTGQNYSMISPVKIAGCTVSGDIRSASDAVGGLVGKTFSDVTPTQWDNNEMVNLIIEDSHASVDIYAFGKEVGGLVGNAISGSVTIFRSSTRGNIFNGFQSIGGLVGTLIAGRGRIQNSYSLMNIQGAQYIGGFIGSIAQGLVQSYVGFDYNYFAGTFDAPNSSAVYIGAIVGNWVGLTNGDAPLKLLYDETKAQLNGTKFNRANVKRGNSVPLTTTQMKDIKVFLEHNFDIFNTWYANEGTAGEYLRLKGEFNEDLFLMQGKGTEEDPYQIKTVDNLISIDAYDKQNWRSYNTIVTNENTFTHPSYKADMNFSAPIRNHYKLTNDIDLNVYPWNVVGWYPLSKVNEQGSPTTLPQQYIVDTLWERAWIESNRGYRTYDSIGKHTGYTDGVKTLTGGTQWSNGVGGVNGGFIKGFMGILDGNDFKIKNLYIKEWKGLSRLGLFDVISGGTVQNLELENVKLDVDYNRGETLPTGTLSAGILASIIQTGSAINRVSTNGVSTIKDYRNDVGGAKFNVSGLVHEGRKLDRTNGSELKRAVIRNSNTRIVNTVTNVDTSDIYKSHFTPFMNRVYYTRIENSYSASTQNAKNAQNTVISGVHGDRVFARTIDATGSVLRSYYDSQVVNAVSGADEATVSGKVEIYGRNTEAMKLQSTYVGWDFNNIWDTNGQSYPSFKPFDPNYVPPSNAIEYVVLATVDALYMIASANGVSKNVKNIILKSHMRKGMSNVSTKKSGTTDVKTQVESLFAIAFAYDNPVIAEREVLATIEQLNMKSDKVSVSVREHVVSTFIEEIEAFIDTERINKGAFYNGFTIEAIKNNSIVLKISDDRIKTIEYNGRSIVVNNQLFMTIRVEQSELIKGDNIVQIIARDEVGTDLLVKSLNINKAPAGKHTGEQILVNGRYYTVVADNSGELTLDKNLESFISRINDEDAYNIVETSRLTLKPEINGLEPVFIGAKFTNGMIKDEYELIGNVETTTTKINMQTLEEEVPVKTEGIATFGNRSDGNLKYKYTPVVEGWYEDTDFVTVEDVSGLVAPDDGLLDTISIKTPDAVKFSINGAITVNVVDWFEKNVAPIAGSTVADKVLTMKTEGYTVTPTITGTVYSTRYGGYDKNLFDPTLMRIGGISTMYLDETTEISYTPTLLTRASIGGDGLIPVEPWKDYYFTWEYGNVELIQVGKDKKTRISSTGMISDKEVALETTRETYYLAINFTNADGSNISNNQLTQMKSYKYQLEEGTSGTPYMYPSNYIETEELYLETYGYEVDVNSIISDGTISVEFYTSNIHYAHATLHLEMDYFALEIKAPPREVEESDGVVSVSGEKSIKEVEQVFIPFKN